MEPMHKFYDPKLFHVMSEEELRLEYAPKEVDGVVLRPEDAATLDAVEQARRAVDVRTPEHFLAAGFDLTFTGPETALPSVAQPVTDPLLHCSPGALTLCACSSDVRTCGAAIFAITSPCVVVQIAH